MKIREAAVQKLASKLVEAKNAVGIKDLLAELRPSFKNIPKQPNTSKNKKNLKISEIKVSRPQDRRF